jgi:hypothetical protein
MNVSDDFSDDVTDASKAFVNHAVYLRGNIIISYAHIEFLLTDICLKAWQLSEYSQFARAFPYRIESRIRAVRTLFESEGPLKRHHQGIQPALDKLLNFEELRHFVAHGLLIVSSRYMALDLPTLRLAAESMRTGIVRSAEINIHVRYRDSDVSKIDQSLRVYAESNDFPASAVPPRLEMTERPKY